MIAGEDLALAAVIADAAPAAETDVEGLGLALVPEVVDLGAGIGGGVEIVTGGGVGIKKEVKRRKERREERLRRRRQRKERLIGMKVQYMKLFI